MRIGLRLPFHPGDMNIILIRQKKIKNLEQIHSCKIQKKKCASVIFEVPHEVGVKMGLKYRKKERDAYQINFALNAISFVELSPLNAFIKKCLNSLVKSL